jgi:hypothetical protein
MTTVILRTTVILTTTVYVQNKSFIYQTDPEERIKNYNDSINKWKNTNLKIVIVENSGYPFDQFKQFVSDRFEIISFNESEINTPNDSKGLSELFSINYAFKNSKIIKNGDFIVKITGRYFVPEFENINLKDYQAICQNDYRRCEIVGCSYNNFEKVFKYQTDVPHIEFLYESRIQKLDKILILKKMKISPTCMGGFNCIMNSL